MTSFLLDCVPSWHVVAVVGPLGTVWAYACLYLCGRLKRDRQWKTGYTRKVFHFLIFATVAGLHATGGLPAVCVFGAATSGVIFYALWRADGHLLYEAMAREADAPHRTHYIVAPYLATLLGGVLTNLLFGPVAVLGYLVTGFGDAVGEPVGTRFGRHVYHVPSLRAVVSTRSYEGSLAVLAACTLAIVAAFALTPTLHFTPRNVVLIPALALGCAVLEAISPHGWDNLTLQVVPAWAGSLLLGP